MLATPIASPSRYVGVTATELFNENAGQPDLARQPKYGPKHDMLIAKHMPKGPKGQKRPADVIGNAVHVMRIATGEIQESPHNDDGKSKAAVELGRKGGEARAKSISKARRAEIARQAAKKRWRNTRGH